MMRYETPSNRRKYDRQDTLAAQPQPAKAKLKTFLFLLTNLVFIAVVTILTIFISVWMAGSTLLEDHVFPQGTTVSGVHIGGLKYEDGLSLVLDKNQTALDDMDVHIIYNDNTISLDAQDLGIVACVEEVLHDACYTSEENEEAPSSLGAITQPKQAQIIDISQLFDTTTIEATLQDALSDPQVVEDTMDSVYNYDTLDESDTLQKEPILHVQYQESGPENKQVLLGVNAQGLYEYVAEAEVLNAQKYDLQLIQYRDLIEKYSTMYGLDPAFITATIFVESSFRETVVSHAGAIGLMQVMPETGLWAADKIGIENYTTDMLYEPETNINIGCWYMAYLMDRFQSNQQTVSAAYNAGHNKVDEWLTDRRYSEDGKTLYAIPYDETRNHVRRIATYYEIYKGVYAG